MYFISLVYFRKKNNKLQQTKPEKEAEAKAGAEEKSVSKKK